ncbi:MAG TPA: DUF2306 domain-containing protein [Vicinamibacterales bacterium]
MRTLLLPVHITAGGAAILLGATALLARKGAWLHRRVGRFFVYAMLAMGLSGSILALRDSLANVNAVGGFVSVYFVVTALMTVQAPSAWTRRIDISALIFALALTVYEIAFALKMYAAPHHMLYGVPFVAMFIFAAITGLASVGDVRVLRAGPLRGGRRLARHLWRMCFALVIATASFFSIRARVAKILPAPFTTAPMRMLPILLVLVAMTYWLWRVRRRQVAARLIEQPIASAARP